MKGLMAALLPLGVAFALFAEPILRLVYGAPFTAGTLTLRILGGAAITYGSAWQSYDQSGWYTLSSTYGPWFSGGCVGCYTLRASGYILWGWHSALVNVSHSGSSHLDSTMYAYGGLSF